MGASVDEELAQKLPNPIIRKLKRKKVYVRFKYNIWEGDLAERGSLFSFNWGVKYLLFVIDVFTKIVWVKSLKDKKAKTVLHGFIEIVKEYER